MPGSSSKLKMTRHQWEVARQMYLSGMSYKAIAEHFKITPASVSKRCYNKGWKYSEPQDKDRNGLEVNLPIEQLKERYKLRMGKMIDKDAGILEKKMVTTLGGIREKYGAAKDMHVIARDVFDINGEQPQQTNNFLITGGNLYKSLFGENPKSINCVEATPVTIESHDQIEAEQLVGVNDSSAL